MNSGSSSWNFHYFLNLTFVAYFPFTVGWLKYSCLSACCSLIQNALLLSYHSNSIHSLLFISNFIFSVIITSQHWRVGIEHRTLLVQFLPKSRNYWDNNPETLSMWLKRCYYRMPIFSYHEIYSASNAYHLNRDLYLGFLIKLNILQLFLLIFHSFVHLHF